MRVFDFNPDYSTATGISYWVGSFIGGLFGYKKSVNEYISSLDKDIQKMLNIGFGTIIGGQFGYLCMEHKEISIPIIVCILVMKGVETIESMNNWEEEPQKQITHNPYYNHNNHNRKDEYYEREQRNNQVKLEE